MTSTNRDWDRIARFRSASLRLLAHVRDEHGVHTSGTASQIEIVHATAHRREGTPWHADAWQLPTEDQEVRR